VIVWSRICRVKLVNSQFSVITLKPPRASESGHGCIRVCMELIWGWHHYIHLVLWSRHSIYPNEGVFIVYNMWGSVRTIYPDDSEDLSKKRFTIYKYLALARKFFQLKSVTRLLSSHSFLSALEVNSSDKPPSSPHTRASRYLLSTLFHLTGEHNLNAKGQ